MAIKIPSAYEAGFGQKLAETPRIPLSTGKEIVGEAIGQGGLRIGGQLADMALEQKAHEDKLRLIEDEKLVQAQADEADYQAKMFTLGLQGELVRGTKAIAARQDLNIEGKKAAFDELYTAAESQFGDNVPRQLQNKYGFELAKTGQTAKQNFESDIIKLSDNQRQADNERGLVGVRDFIFENPEYRSEGEAQANYLINDMSLDPTAKEIKRQEFFSLLDADEIKNTLAQGDPELLLATLKNRDESGAYTGFKNLTPEDRVKYIEQAQKAAAEQEGLRLADEVWGQSGPRDEMDVIDIEKAVELAGKRAKTDDGRKAATTALREKNTIHNQARTARIDNYENAIWEAYVAGKSSAQIYKMAEFVALPADKQMAVKDKITSYVDRATRLSREDKAELVMQQSLRYQELVSNPVALRATNLEMEYKSKTISDSGYKSLKLATSPLNSEKYTAAVDQLADVRKAGGFNPEDPFDNDRQWAERLQQLQDYTATHPNEDPIAFVEKIVNPVKDSFVSKLLDKMKGSSQIVIKSTLPGRAVDALTGDKQGVKTGDIRDGYRFKGGDPAKMENWEAVQ